LFILRYVKGDKAMKYNYSEIGNRIRTERKNKGYNQYELIEKLKEKNCSIGRNTLSDLENGKISQEKISMFVLMNIAETLDTSTFYLLGETTHKTKVKETIWNKLRLSGEVVDRIANYDDVQIGMLNSLICYGDNQESKDNLQKLLDSIYEYKLISSSDKSSITIQNPIYNNLRNEYTKKEDIEKYLKYNVISCLEDCLKDDYWITDFISKVGKDMYQYKNNPQESQIRKAEKEMIHDIKEKSKKKKGSN
jgi:transcriptional regulator with XRE-family HTH domain